MKYINNKIIAFTLIAASIMSCTDEYNCQLQVEKPQNAAINEYLAQFDLLKSYIDRSGTPFQLAVNVPGSEFAKKEIAYKPLIPTRAYIILLNIVIDPNNAATKSNLKKPIKPQFTAPIITKSKAIVSNTFIKTTPLLGF